MLSLLKKPILFLPLFVILSRTVEEAYPFSHFPMYATLDTEPTWYVYLADSGTGEALPMEHLVGVRPAAAKKMLRTRLRRRAEAEGLDKDSYTDLSEIARSEVGLELLAFLRKRHAALVDTQRQVPSFTLMLGEITLTPGKVPDEVVTRIAAEL